MNIYSICKQSDPDISQCKWKDYTHDLQGRLLEKSGWQECKEGWCHHCAIGYHAICETLKNEISHLFGVDIEINKDFLTVLQDLIDGGVKRANRRGADKFSISQEEKKLAAYSTALSKCASYRRNHHKYCIRNIYDASEKHGDPGHKSVVQRLNIFNNETVKGIRKIRVSKSKAKSPVLKNKPKTKSPYIKSSFPKRRSYSIR
jgi:hypothetical protein